MAGDNGFAKSELASEWEYSIHITDRERCIRASNVRYWQRECLLFTHTCHVSLQAEPFAKAWLHAEVLQIPRRSALWIKCSGPLAFHLPNNMEGSFFARRAFNRSETRLIRGQAASHKGTLNAAIAAASIPLRACVTFSC
jgi:hypothetical protein